LAKVPVPISFWFWYCRLSLPVSGEFGLSSAKVPVWFFQPYSYWFLSLSHSFTDWHWFELVFTLFLALLLWVVCFFPFFFSGCYSSYLVYLCGGVIGFFVVEIMTAKPETSLINAPMTYVKLNGKNYSYWARSVEVFLKSKGWFPHLTSGKPEGIAPSH
jgi:hypothetical protein